MVNTGGPEGFRSKHGRSYNVSLWLRVWRSHMHTSSACCARESQPGKGPVAETRPQVEAGGARHDDDLSYHDRLAHSSTSVALGTERKLGR